MPSFLGVPARSISIEIAKKATAGTSNRGALTASDHDRALAKELSASLCRGEGGTPHIMPQPRTACINVRYPHSTGVKMGAPLFLTNTTRNFAGSVLLALRPTT